MKPPRNSSRDTDPRADTARPWKTTRVSTYILQHLPDGTILDFGCGKYANQVQLFRERGRDADGYDLWWEDHPLPVRGLYSRLSPPSRWYDLVSLSNVLNVQGSPQELSDTLRESRRYLKPGGRVVANYPADPRKIGWGAKKMRAYVLSQWGGSVERKGLIWIFQPLSFDS